MKYLDNIIEHIFRFRLVYVVTTPHPISTPHFNFQDISRDSKSFSWFQGGVAIIVGCVIVFFTNRTKFLHKTLNSSAGFQYIYQKIDII